MNLVKQFLSCDWGTSSFRLRLVNADSLEILDEIQSDQGIAATHTQWLATQKLSTERSGFYKKIIAEAVKKLSKTSEKLPLLLSGMASSTIGIMELPYSDFPFAWKGKGLLVRMIEEDEVLAHPLYLVSGLRTNDDIMRGEETMLLGCEQNDGNGVYIFPGTHSKHVFVKAGVATDFKTYVTGELFNIMRRNSILTNSLEAGEERVSFEQGVADSENSNLLHSLFLVRSRHVLNGTSKVSNYQYLSGLIIGTELKDLKGHYSVSLVGEEPLMESYRTALNLFGIRKVISISATDALLRGHGKIFKEVIEK